MCIGHISDIEFLFDLNYSCCIEFGLFGMLIWICIGHLLLYLDLFGLCNIRIN
jgi:hypothetical protein